MIHTAISDPKILKRRSPATSIKSIVPPIMHIQLKIAFESMFIIQILFFI